MSPQIVTDPKFNVALLYVLIASSTRNHNGLPLPVAGHILVPLVRPTATQRLGMCNRLADSIRVS